MSGNSIGNQIIGELGQVARDVGKQTAQIPKDVVGSALESLGVSSGKKQGGSTFTVQKSGPEGAGGKSAWEQFANTPDAQVKKQIARKALEELSRGEVKKQREPSIWERLQQEQEQKKQMMAQQKAVSQSQTLAMPTSKRPRGDLYGKKAKSTAMENKSLRQD